MIADDKAFGLSEDAGLSEPLLSAYLAMKRFHMRLSFIYSSIQRYAKFQSWSHWSERWYVNMRLGKWIHIQGRQTCLNKFTIFLKKNIYI